MRQDSHETHTHPRLCDRRRWPRSLWIDRRCAAHCATNALASSRSNRGADSYRNARADRDTDPNALSFRSAVTQRERIAQPERVAVRCH